ncbi:MAG: alpha-E domain-containing protein [Lacipirellulaceae bacterium]
MLSRVADSIYWMHRYVERAENVARFIGVVQSLSLGGVDAQWSTLVYASGDEEEFDQRPGGYSRENVLRFVLFDEENGNSILSCVRAARENARSIRGEITVPQWQAINRFYLQMQDAVRESQLHIDNPHSLLQRVLRSSHQVIGVTSATLSHDERWSFGQLGLLLERADKSSRILDVKYFTLLPNASLVGQALDVVQWSALLESTSALHMYRKRFGRISPRNVVDFLVFDRLFPRSMRFCITQAEERLRAITGSQPGAFSIPAEQLLGQLAGRLNYTGVDEVIGAGLHEFVDDFQSRVNAIAEAVYDEFFRVPTPPVQLQSQS